MTVTSKRWIGPLAAALLAATPAAALAETLQGNIISHDGDKLVVRAGAGETTLTLSGATKIQAVSGLLGAQREDRPASDLIRGLAVTVETGPGAEAAKVTFKTSDLKTAQAIQAGIEQPRQRLVDAQAENDRRFSQVGQFTEKGQVRVYFASGSAAIDAKGKQDLAAFVEQAKATPGAVLRVVGHTDSTGSAAVNQRLSNQRGSAVTAYLVRTLGVPAEKILSPAGLGAEVTAADDVGAPSNAESRRVTVSILVSKAAERTTASR